jgi:hypothetical protein
MLSLAKIRNEGESSDLEMSTLAGLVKHDPSAVDMARVHRILTRILIEDVLKS